MEQKPVRQPVVPRLPEGGVRSFLDDACHTHGYRKIDLDNLEFKTVKNIVKIDYETPDGVVEKEAPDQERCQTEMALDAEYGSIALCETTM